MLLIVHSRSDEVIPFEHAQRLNQAASETEEITPPLHVAQLIPLR